MPRRRTRITVCLGVVMLFASVSSASAFAFVVDSTGDAADVGIDGICATAQGACTLRAAIQEANATAGSDSISFSPGFDGDAPASTIQPGSMLPAVTAPLVVDGGDCPAGALEHRPCVGLRPAAGGPGLDFKNSDSFSASSVRGLALFGAIDAPLLRVADNDVTVENSWFGVALDGVTVAGAAVGVQLDHMRSADLGGAAPAERNVFVDNDVGLHVRASHQAVIKGSYFGLLPDGRTLAGNGDAIQVNGVDLHVPGEAEGADLNEIGGSLSAAELASPGCDGPCNVIVGSALAGVWLTGEETGDFGANSTKIRGNHIGISPAGDASMPNGVGIDASASGNTTVGGAPTDGNLVGGNAVAGIVADGEAGGAGLLVSHNKLGLDASGTVAVPDGLVAAAIGGGVFAANRLGGTASAPELGGVLITPPAYPANVHGNTVGIGVGGADVGLPWSGIEDAAGEGLLADNVIGNMRGAGSAAIRFSEAVSTLTGGGVAVGNLIGVAPDGTSHPNDGAGIRLEGGAEENTIGGDSGENENLISNSGGNAIEIVSPDSFDNLIASNRGTDNAGLFIDLGGDGPGNDPSGPNDGVQEPTVTAASATAASGNTPDPFGTVRVYWRATTFAGRIDRYLGSTEADGFDWSLTYDPPVPDGGEIVATQTPADVRSTSELSFVPDPIVPPAQPPPAGNPPSGGSGGLTPPPQSSPAVRFAVAANLRLVRRLLRRTGLVAVARKRRLNAVGLRAPGPGLLSADVVATRVVHAAGRLRLFRARRRLTAAGRTTLVLRSTRRARKAIRNARRIRVRITVRFTSTASQHTTASDRLVLTRQGVPAPAGRTGR